MDQGRTSTARRIPGAGFINSVLAALVLPIWLLALAAWAVQLGGLAAVQASQGRRYLQFDWFITVFDLVVLLLMPFHILTRRSSPGIVALKAVVTVLEILRTNVWNDARLGRGIAGQNFLRVDSLTNPGITAGTSRVNTLFAGYLITAFFNCLLILALGNLPAWSGSDVSYLARKGKEQAEDTDAEHASGGAGMHTNGQTRGHHSSAPTAANGGGHTGGNVAGTNAGAAHHVPRTHLTETQQDDGLAGRTYVDRGQNAAYRV